MLHIKQQHAAQALCQKPFLTNSQLRIKFEPAQGPSNSVQKDYLCNVLGTTHNHTGAHKTVCGPKSTYSTFIIDTNVMVILGF